MVEEVLVHILEILLEVVHLVHQHLTVVVLQLETTPLVVVVVLAVVV
jgi:hypothetical protein